MLASKLLSAAGSTTDTLYSDDVFSAYTYTGNGSTQTINNGIDLAGKGGLVWIKRRDGTYGHVLADSGRGVTHYLDTSTTAAQDPIGAVGMITSFNSNGFSCGPYSWTTINNGQFSSHTFRKASKFFDVVTYPGAGSYLVNHSLGQMPGMIILKGTSGASNWGVWHRGDGTTAKMGLSLNSTSASTWDSSSGVTSTTFNPGLIRDHFNNTFSTIEETYVAYLFAHDTSTDGLIQCGSFTTDGSGNATVNLGWEPQYLMHKKSSTTGNWQLTDNARDFHAESVSGNITLQADTSAAEAEYSGSLTPTATGFRGMTGNLSASTTYIYLAIRRPNKPPTLGTQVYNAIARTGTGAAATVTGVGFAPDFAVVRERAVALWSWRSRLTGATNRLRSDSTAAEDTAAPGVTFDAMDGVRFSDGNSEVNGALTYINHFFKRAPGVFDQVCYTGTDTTQTINHSLGAAPEMIIVKRRNSAGSDWCVYTLPTTATKTLYLNATTASSNDNLWSPGPTSSAFYLPGDARVNGLFTYAAYLFATKPGISKVGSYTGNGTTQTINCGFTTGARFILIKRTDSTGDWYIWDTARGIVSANDPHLSLNTTAAEVTTDDSVDPDVSGFIVNQVAATNINVSGAGYIFLSIA